MGVAAMRIFFRDAPPGKYDDIAAQFESGEISWGVAFHHTAVRALFDDGASNFSESAFAENEREVSAAIERIKNTLDKSAVKEEVHRTIKDILSTYVSYADYMKGVQDRIWPGLPSSAGKASGLAT